MPSDAVSVPYSDPAVTLGWSVFETLRAQDGEVRRVDEHLERLARSADAALIGMPDRAVLAAEIAAVAAAQGGLARVRVTLTGGGRRLVVAEVIDPGRVGRPIRAIRGPWRQEPFLGGAVKHGS